MHLYLRSCLYSLTLCLVGLLLYNFNFQLKFHGIKNGVSSAKWHYIHFMFVFIFLGISFCVALPFENNKHYTKDERCCSPFCEKRHSVLFVDDTVFEGRAAPTWFVSSLRSQGCVGRPYINIYIIFFFFWFTVNGEVGNCEEIFSVSYKKVLCVYTSLDTAYPTFDKVHVI